MPLSIVTKPSLGIPPRDGSDGSGDEYLSDENELGEHDLHTLDTDYHIQRHLSANARDTIPDIQHKNPDLRDLSKSADTPIRTSHRYKNQPLAWNEEHISPAASSHGKPIDTDDCIPYDQDFAPSYHNARAYQSQQRRRPLIDFIKNEWRHIDNSYSSDSSPMESAFATPSCLHIFAAPNFQRAVLFLLALLFLLWGNWKTWAGPRLNEDYMLKTTVNDKLKSNEGWFGGNMRPQFLNMIQVKILDHSLVPQNGDKKRLIVVGDIHGCHEELVSLLTELQYEARTDHLVFTGDMISKGPASSAVVDLAISAQASCVRGNHEDRILLTYRDMAAHGKLFTQAPASPAAPIEENVGDDYFARGDPVDRELAQTLTNNQVEYLLECPIILDIGHLQGLGNLHVVHAGLIAGVPLDDQDPVGVMHMRTVDLETHVPSSSGKGTAWFKLWNKYQSMVPGDRRSTVLYGHDSRRGLQIEKYSKGLDTGCVRGGRLSALIIDDTATLAKPNIVSVKCKDYVKDQDEIP